VGEFWEENLILRVVCGSRAQGLDGPESDTDTRGVCVPPKRFLLGLERFEQHESPGCDHVTYSLEKFARLALQGNPNIIETLYTDRRHILHVDAHGERLIEARDAFLSRRVGERFVGYAEGQLGRMNRHRRWLDDPPGAEPDPSEFGGVHESGRVRWTSAQRQKDYKAAHKKWTQFQAWRKNRNPKRAALEAKHGYDTKHAMHVCRLLKVGAEILTEGIVRVERPDSEWLGGIRQGSLPYEELIAWVEAEIARIPELVASSSLPEEPDVATIEALVVSIQESFHFGGSG
jgi:predicted nucleotidyltransferase